MKISTSLSMACAALLSTVHADLTPFNATYDLFMTNQLLTLGSATQVVVETHDQWLLDAFQPVVETFEMALTVAKQPGDYYWTMLTSFFNASAAHEKSFKDLIHKVSSVDQSAMAYAPRPYVDATFAVFQGILKANPANSKNTTTWGNETVTWQQLYDTERKALEALIDTKDRDTNLITVRMERLVHKLQLSNESLKPRYAHAYACLDKRMRTAYQQGQGVDPRLNCDDVPPV